MGLALTGYDFYSGVFGGVYDEEVISPLLERAEADIRCVCSDEAEEVFLRGGDGAVNDSAALAVMWAACLQAEFLAECSAAAVSGTGVSGGGLQGGVSDVSGASGSSGAAVSSVKLGDFSVSFSSAGGKSTSGSSGVSGGSSGDVVSVNGCARGNLCGRALLILDKRGLLYRGGVCL